MEIRLIDLMKYKKQHNHWIRCRKCEIGERKGGHHRAVVCEKLDGELALEQLKQ